MAVSCPRCGWQYDVTLFQFGRTINCACGERVGLESRIELPAKAEVRFFADVMVHRLTRLLRALGYDTLWEDAIADAELVRRSQREHRYILTLDRRLAQEWKVGNVLLLKSELPLEQLRDVADRFGIEMPKEMFTRCLVCNTVLGDASAAEIAEQAPAAVRDSYREFRFCPGCRKVYWNGSHTDRMRAAIKSVLESRPG